MKWVGGEEEMGVIKGEDKVKLSTEMEVVCI